MTKVVFERIKQLLDSHSVQYTFFEHEPVRTSEDAARVRERITSIPAAEHLKRGAKAMIIRSEGKYYQFVLSAVRKLDFKTTVFHQSMIGGLEVESVVLKNHWIGGILSVKNHFHLFSI